jgi:CRP-like cAMP-binding protein
LTNSRLQTGAPPPEDWRDRLPDALGCTGRSAELIHEHQTLLRVSPGTDIFAQGSQPEAIYLLLKGKISVVGSIGYQEAVLGEIKSGMLCDIGACVLGSPHNYTARPVAPCDLVVLPIEVWQRLVEAFPSSLMKVIDQLSSDLRDIWKRIASM